VTARRRDRPAPTAFPGDDRAGGSAGGGLSGAWARQRISPSRSRKLLLDCLDAYLDGTPRLRLAAGKALRERTVPVHEEAAQAIRDLVKVRETQPDQGIFDRDLGRTVRYLFLRNGVLAHPDYLFASPLAQICEDLAILNGDGKPALHAHRFRHTLGTQLAEKGARTQTIMKILGHKSAGMSMTYANISDPVVLADYQSVLQPGAVIAGPLCLERQLADDAQVRGWDREADRHQRTADRIRSLLSELGEPSDGPEDMS